MLYEVLPNPLNEEATFRDLPVLKLFRCGDGCCAEWELDNQAYMVGEKIHVTEYQFSDYDYQVDDEEWSVYRPAFYDISQYVTDGYLKLVTNP